MTPNVIGGPLDGGFIEPHDTDEQVQVSNRTKGYWHWYQWESEHQKWIFVRSQKTVLQ